MAIHRQKTTPEYDNRPDVMIELSPYRPIAERDLFTCINSLLKFREDMIKGTVTREYGVRCIHHILDELAEALETRPVRRVNARDEQHRREKYSTKTEH